MENILSSQALVVPGLIRCGDGLSVDMAVIERFIAFLDVRDSSVETYRRCLGLFFAWLVRMGIVSPRRDDVIAWRESLKAAGRQPTTIHTYLYVVRSFFRWAGQTEQYRDVAYGVKAPVVSHYHKRDALSGEQVAEILATIDRGDVQGLRDYALFLVMVTGGLRCVEVARARVRDFRTLGGNSVLYLQGKGRDERSSEYVKLEPVVVEALKKYLASRGKLSGDAPLFVSFSHRSGGGKWLTAKSVGWIVKEILRRAGYDDDRLSAHSLRHTAVTLALLGGESLEAVKDFARHANIATTLVYSHAIERAKNTCEATVAKMIFPEA